MKAKNGKAIRSRAMSALEIPELLKYVDVQKLLALSPRSVRRLVERGELSVVYVGAHSPRFKPEDVLAFVERGLGLSSHQSTP